jgi:hypothetical protein
MRHSNVNKINRMALIMNVAYRYQCFFALTILLIVILLTGCATRTHYSLDIAKESSHYKGMTKAQAVGIIKANASVSGEYADYRSFIIDETGFSYKKTTKGTRTEWVDKKAIKKQYTNTLTRNVPWSAVYTMTPFLQQSDVFGDGYIVWVGFKVTEVKYYTRRKVNTDIELKAKSYKDLTDIVAALKLLTGL